MSMFGQMSDQAKHATTWTLTGTTLATWLVDHSSLLTALVALATFVWVMLGWVERAQRIYLTWKHGLNPASGDE